VVIAALGGANMLMTGVIGLYVGRIYAEAKRRPLYIVERAVGFEDATLAARRPAATLN
jgi:polyisoprenyl-phosphate glycosyltransferase